MQKHQDFNWDLPPPDPHLFSLNSELNTNSNLRERDLEDLKMWIQQEGLPYTTDCELVKFLHACDYDVENAKINAKSFYTSRRNNADVFSKWDVHLSNLQSILEVITVAVCPQRTPENYRVVFSGLRTSETANYVFEDVCKVLLMTLESVFLTEPTVKGVVMIFDLPLAGIGHFRKFGFSLPKKLATYLQVGMPLKMVSIHITGCSRIIDGALRMVRQLVTKKDWEKVFVHRGNDFTHLHEKIPRYCLPSDLGGTLPPVVELTEMTIRRFEALKDFYEFNLA